MRKKLEIQISQLKQAIERLEEALKLPPTQIHKDATIQRFEFTFELAWKVMQGLANEKGLETASPKDSIRTAAQLSLIESVETWFGFLDARNLSSHIYNEEIANEVYHQIKKFLPEVKKLLSRLREV